MSTQQQAAVMPPPGMAPSAPPVAAQQAGPLAALDKVKENVNRFMDKQPIPFQVIVKGVQGSASGAVLGSVFYFISKQSPEPMFPQVDKAGGKPVDPKLLPVQFAALTGAQAAATHAIKKYWKEEEDAYTAGTAAFCGGAAYGLAAGQSPLTAGLTFAIFSTLIFQAGKMFGGSTKEDEYRQARFMLQTLGLEDQWKKLRKQQLTDRTIMLWDNDMLKESNVPAGPRRIILHHLDSIRNPKLQSTGPPPLYPYFPPPPAHH